MVYLSGSLEIFKNLLGPCLVLKKIANFFRFFLHIESYGICIEH